MRRSVAVVILAAIVLDCAPTLPQVDYSRVRKEQPIVVSERVGDVIDAEEREKYELFPAISGFHEARFYPLRKGGYVLELITDERTFLSLNYWPHAIMIIREYIEDYEDLKRDSLAYVTKWSILDYDTLGIPITADEVRLIINRNRSSALRKGAGCFGLSALMAFFVFWGVAASGGSSGVDIGPALGAAAGLSAAIVVMVGGLIGSIIVYLTSYKKDKKDPDSILKQIKISRKPRRLK